MSAKEKQSKSRVERKKERTVQSIIDISINLFKKQGFDATTMEQIAKEVDIAKTTLYNYFSSKEEIIGEYMKRSFSGKNLQRIMHFRELPDTRSRMILIFSELIKGVNEHKEIFERYLVYRMQIMVSFQQDDDVKSGLYLLGHEIIQWGQKVGEIRKDLPLYVLEDLFEFAFIEAVKQFYMEPENFNTNKILENCVDLFLNGVGEKIK